MEKQKYNIYSVTHGILMDLQNRGTTICGLYYKKDLQVHCALVVSSECDKLVSCPVCLEKIQTLKGEANILLNVEK